MTKTKQRIIEAYSRGYRMCEAGTLCGPKGTIKVALTPRQRYPTFSTNWGGCVFGLPVHQFAAFCYYGDEYIKGAKIVRHLDGNCLNLQKTNIVLGTTSENEYDKPIEMRQQAAKFARKAQGHTPTNAKLTSEQVLEIRKIYAEARGKKLPNGQALAMSLAYGVSRTVLIKIKKGEYYANVR